MNMIMIMNYDKFQYCIEIIMLYWNYAENDISNDNDLHTMYTILHHIMKILYCYDYVTL